MTRRSWSLLACCWIFASVAGCGSSNLAAVSGKVTYDGEPVAEGEIRFIPTSQGKDMPGMSGGKIVNGEYSIPSDKGVPVGNCRVEISARKKTGKQIEAVMPAPPGSMIDETISYIPREYNTASTLTFDVQPGSNSRDFLLEKVGK